jgi:hypothetical protein
MIGEARRIAGDPQKKFVTDDELIRQLNRAQDIVYAKNPRWWFLFYDSWNENTTIAALPSVAIYSLATLPNFGHIDTIRYQYNSNNVNILYQLKNMSDVEFDARFRNLNKVPVDFVRFFKLLPPDTNSTAGYIQVDPKPQNANIGNFYVNYYQKMSELVAVSDTTKVPYPSLLEDFAIAYIFRVRGEIARAEEYEARFYGPADKLLTIEKLNGIALLMELDKAQKKTQGQPGHLMKWRGQKAITMLFGENLTASPDYLRETYFDSRTGG